MQAALDSLNGETSPAATMAREKYAAARKVAEDHNEPEAATGLASRCTPPAVRPARRSCPRINSRNAVTQRDVVTSFRFRTVTATLEVHRFDVEILDRRTTRWPSAWHA